MDRRAFTMLLLQAAATLSLLSCGKTVVLPPDAPAFAPAPAPAAREGLLYLYRLNAGPESSAPIVRVDGKPYVELPEGGYVAIPLSSGVHSVNVDWTAWQSSLNLMAQVVITPKSESYLKLAGSFGVGPFHSEHGIAVAPQEKAYATAELRLRCRRAPLLQSPQ